MRLFRRTTDNLDVPERVQLDLSGPHLKQAMQKLVKGCEDRGGIEKYSQALQLKIKLFQDSLADGKVKDLEIEAFMGLCTFMATVRRRVAPYLDDKGFAKIKAGLIALLQDSNDTSTTDARWGYFVEQFPQDKQHRWVRDLAAEVLHNTDPERYPNMCRWIWDAKANTGVIREAWYGDNVDNMTIPVPDGYETYVVLREELAQYLTSNGFYQDIMVYVDLLCGQVYGDYISAQGGSYLKTDFSAAVDPMEHVRRILGLDGVKPNSSRTRLKSIDGEAFVLDDTKLLN